MSGSVGLLSGFYIGNEKISRPEIVGEAGQGRSDCLCLNTPTLVPQVQN